MPADRSCRALLGPAALYAAMDPDEIVSIRFIPPTYHLRYRTDGERGAIANIDLVREHVRLVIEDPERAVIELGLEGSESCPQPPED